MKRNIDDLTGLPGADLVSQGLSDLRDGVTSETALLVLIAAPRLRRLGFEIPARPDVQCPYEHTLYSVITASGRSGAHSYDLSLLRRISSFARALESGC